MFERFVIARYAVTSVISVALAIGASQVNAAKEIIHDADHYELLKKYGKQWSMEDKDVQDKLKQLEKKFGKRPNIVHIMWDDNSWGEVGIPESC